jgi:hypothetical protein
MVPGFTILGRLAMPSQQGICALTGLSQVIKSPLVDFYARLELIPSPGCDRIVQERIYRFLDTDNRFRAQIADLLARECTEIEVEEEMTYHSFVTFLTSCCISIEFSVSDMSPTQLWTLTYSAGYLTKMVNGSGLVAPILTQNQLLDDAGSDTDEIDAGDTPSTYEGNVSGTKKFFVCIPNFEIRGKFHQWLQNHISQRMPPEIKSKSIGLFREMVSGDISSFAAQFGKLVWDTMPIEFLGRKEFVYQAYVCAFFAELRSSIGTNRLGRPK